MLYIQTYIQQRGGTAGVFLSQMCAEGGARSFDSKNVTCEHFTFPFCFFVEREKAFILTAALSVCGAMDYRQGRAVSKESSVFAPNEPVGTLPGRGCRSDPTSVCVNGGCIMRVVKLFEGYIKAGPFTQKRPSPSMFFLAIIQPIRECWPSTF